MREYAGLSQDVIFVGAGEYAEIWAAEAWDLYQPSAMAAYSGGQEDSPQADD